MNDSTKVYCVEHDMGNLLLVRNCFVVNGHYNCIQNKDGSLSIPHSKLKAYFVMDVPSNEKYQDYDSITRTYPAFELVDRKSKMIKMFCDRCDVEKYPPDMQYLDIPVHITEPDQMGYIDRGTNQVSGKSKRFDLCNACYNRVLQAAFNAIEN